MSVKIRLRRIGAKKKPFYRVVAADSRFARDGRFLETLGHYNPTLVPATFRIDEEKVAKWLNDGAEMSDTVNSLCTQIGFNEKYLKAKKGEDVSGIELKSVITERKKRRKKTKAAAAAPDAAAGPAEASEAPAGKSA